MSKLQAYLRNLFLKAGKQPASAPFLHEVFEFDKTTTEEFEKWRDSSRRFEISDWIKNQYKIYGLQMEEMDECIDFLNTPSAKGFVIYMNNCDYSLRELKFYSVYLKSRITLLGYVNYLSDIRSMQRGSCRETIYRHYLKPSIKDQNGAKSDQLYGNINVELLLKNESPLHFRFCATTYNDHKFKAPKSFDELLEKL